MTRGERGQLGGPPPGPTFLPTLRVMLRLLAGRFGLQAQLKAV